MAATPAPLFPALLVGAAGRSVLIRADAVALNSEPGRRVSAMILIAAGQSVSCGFARNYPQSNKCAYEAVGARKYSFKARPHEPIRARLLLSG